MVAVSRRRWGAAVRALAPKGPVARAVTAGVTSAVLVLSILHAPPAAHAEPAGGKGSGVTAQPDGLDSHGSPAKGVAWPVKRAESAVFPAPVWPRPGKARLTVAGNAAGDRAAPAAAPGLPVRIESVSAEATGSPELTVEVLDRGSNSVAWRDALLIRLTPTSTATRAASVKLAVDYSGFRYAYGGDWASRLRLWRLSTGCAQPKASDDTCQVVSLPSVNDTATSTVTAAVPAGTPTLVAVAAAPSGPEGDFTATPMAPSATWSQSGGTGNFSWSYPIRVPPSLGGPTPKLSLDYSSASVDGRSSAENNQPSWVGEGFELSPGFIERSYVPCRDDMADDQAGNEANNDTKTGDMCWRSSNATMSLNGSGGELIFESGKGWHARNESGAKIERLTGANNGARNGEYWKVTTTDGTEYYFGLNRLPGQSSATNSTWTLPVAGNHPGEPCHSSDFDDSFCDQAWRWNLDYVVDPHGNTMSYWYDAETNYYARNLGKGDNASYVRGGTLKRIDYGTWDRGTGDRSVTPTAQVLFQTADRCESDCSAHDAAHWKDVPWDQECRSATANCDDNSSPTFWSTKRLATITTRVWDTTKSTPGWQDVDSWTLDHTYPPVGDGSDHAGMWLNSITHKGLVVDTDATGPTPLNPVTLPPVTFEPVSKPNRVLTAHNTTNNRHRISNIVTETGAKIQVTYSEPDCTANNLPSAPHTNTKLCYPVVGPDPADPDGPEIVEWWHKYVVTQVSESDLRIMVDGVDHGAPVKHTSYTYLGNPAWHYADDDGLVKPKRKTWNQFRGYATVETRVGEAPRQTLTRTTYLRGMHGDRLAPSGGTRTVTVPASLGSETVYDEDHFAGMVREEVVYNGVDTKPVSKIVNVPWRSPATASRTINGDTVTARFTDTATVYTAVALGVDGQAGWRTTRTHSSFHDTYGTLESLQDDGDIAKTGDETCTTHSYNRNTDKNLTELVKQTTVTALTCGTAPTSADDIISDTRNYYDGATSVDTPPTTGAVTKVESLKDWTPSGTVWQTTAESTYDVFGRVKTATDIRGNTTTTTYTPASGGPVTKVTTTSPDPNGGAAWTSSVDVRPYWGSPIKTTDYNGRVSEIVYDPLGRVAKVWNLGWPRANHENTPSVEYTYYYSPTRDAYPYTRTRTLNAEGGYLTSYQIFDAFLRPRQVQADGVGGDRVVTDTLYDKAGRAERTYAPHEEPGSPTGSLWVEPAWSVPAVVETVYDDASRPIAEIFLAGDNVTNLVEKWRTTTTYAGDSTKVTPPSGATPTTTVTDAQNRTIELRQHTTAQGVDGPYQATRYTYNRKGQLVAVADADGNEWTYTYDVRGRRITASDPDKGVTSSEYNDYGDLVKTTDARGEVLAYSYDRLGRKTGLYDDTVSAATKRAEWKYDRLYDGQVSRGQLTETIRYEPPGSTNAYRIRVTDINSRYQPLGVDYVIPSVEGSGISGIWAYEYTYSDYTGAPTSMTYPAVGSLATETVTTTYDHASGLPAGLVSNNAGSYVTAQQYTRYGEPTITTREIRSGVYVDDVTTYDPTTRRVTSTAIRSETGGATVSARHYTYDPAGNITSIADTPDIGSSDTQCFRHDSLRRLVSAWTPKSGVDCTVDPTVANLGGPAPYWLDWTFDKVGNRLTEVDHSSAGDTIRTYTVPTGGRGVVRPHAVTAVTTQAPGQTPVTFQYDYDSAGNMTCRPAGTTPNVCPPDTNSQYLSWDPEGRLTSISGDAPTAGSNIYDADGTRILRRDATGTTLYLPGQEVRREGTTVTGTRYYTFAGKLIASRTASGLAWTYTDHQGTQHTTIDAATQAVTVRRQTPYGVPRGSNPIWANQKGFVGGDVDPSGLTHLGAREYDPTLGRFISVDPVMDLADPQQFQAYAYANNSPVSFSDPDGLRPLFTNSAQEDARLQQTTGQKFFKSGGKWRPSRGFERPKDRNGEPILTPAEWLEGVYGTVGRQSRAVADLGSLEIRQGLVQYFCYYHPEICKKRREAEDEKKLEILLELTGIADAKRCLEREAMGCVWAAVGFVPYVGWAKRLKVLDNIAELGAVGRLGKAACSFSGETRVLMADGTTKAIKDIRVGDLVLATNPETGEQGARRVANLWVHEDQVAGLQMADGSAVTTTEDHPFWNQTDQQWQEAQQLDRGDLLQTSTGARLAVDGIDWRTSRRAMAYNLTVDDIHTYHVIAGDAPVLVHNCGGPIRVSPSAQDWGTKGAHVHVGNHEVRIFPDGRGGIGAEPIRLRSGVATPQDVQRAIDEIRSNPQLRADLIDKARSAMGSMNSGEWGMDRNRAAELHFLIRALEQMG